MQESNIPADALGLIVMRADAPPGMPPLIWHEAERSLQPASTLKLLTSLVALERLGPAYRGRTELRSAGEVSYGILHGDLILRGVADPDLDWQAFQGMLQTLRHKGIRHLAGDLVLERGLFQPSRMDVGVPPFDETPEFRYNVIPDALLLNTNLLQLDLSSNGTEVRAQLGTPLDRVTVVSNLTVVDRACEKWEDGWQLPTVRELNGTEGAGSTMQIELRGAFPKNCFATTQINVLDRTVFADRLFRALWTGLGGTLSGMVRESGAAGNAAPDGTPDATTLLAEHKSRPLIDVSRDINKRSDNPIARVTFLALGAAQTPAAQPSDAQLSRPQAASASPQWSAARSERVVRDWLREHGIDDAGLVLENGSGLSRLERIRPAQLAAVLKAGRKSKWAPEFVSTLPIAAVDGAFVRRLHDSPAAQRARIKTGTLRDVSAIAGYVEDAEGHTWILVAMLNHPLAKSPVTRPIMDGLIDWVARIGGVPKGWSPGVSLPQAK